MHFSTTALVGLAALASTGYTAATPREYLLKTSLKPNQASKSRFQNLYLEAYHTGAGLNDATFMSNRSQATAGFLDNATTAQLFTLGGNMYDMVMAQVGTGTYYAWEPVQINGGSGGGQQSSGFSIDQQGLQWNSSSSEGGYDEFGGWLVCEWSHGVPQLFYRLVYDESVAAPCNCADVDLVPVYV